VRRADADGSEGNEEDELQNAADMLYTAVYDATGTAITDAWSTRYDELVAYHADNGTLPPQLTPGGLGSWVSVQRQRRATMSSERKERLEALEWWVWSVRAAPVLVAWDARFGHLVAYHAEHGRLPPRSTPGGLGSWVHKQRQSRATMDAERKARLDALEWWVWDTLESAWSTNFDELVAFYVANGRIPPQSTPGGLGSWVIKQRTRRTAMSAERKARLEALGWWVWDTLDDAWNTQLDELVAYHAEHGRIPPFATPRLGHWVYTQRKCHATMTPERKARLEALEWWVWDALDYVWSTKFDELVAYHAEHGRIPPRSTRALGVWVSEQRRARATMDTERKAKLDALEWWVWARARDSRG
jgi:hypothetical protein